MAVETVEYILKIRDEAEAPLEATAKAAKEVTTALKGTEAEAGKATKALGKEAGVGQKAGQAKEGIAQLGGALSVVSPQLGAMVMTVGQLGGALKGGSVLLEIFGGAAGAVALGAGAVALAGVGAIAAVVGITKAAGEYAKALEPFRGLEGFGVTDATLTNLSRATASLDSLGTVAKQMVVVLGSELAPTVERVGTDLVALALMGLDAWNAMSEGQGIVHALTVEIVQMGLKILTGPVLALDIFAETVAMVARAIGADGLADALDVVTGAYDDLTEGAAENMVAFYGNTDAVKNLEAGLGSYKDRAKALVGVQAEVTEGIKKSTEAMKGYLDASLLLTDANLAPTPMKFTLPTSEGTGFASTFSGAFTQKEAADAAKKAAEEAAAAAERSAEASAAMATAFSSGISGLTGVLSATGPLGTLIAMTWDLLTQGAEIIDSIRMQLQDTPANIERLPEAAKAFIDILPEVVTAIAQAIVEMIPQLVVEMYRLIFVFETLFIDIFAGIMKGIWNMLPDFITSFVEGVASGVWSWATAFWEGIKEFFGVNPDQAERRDQTGGSSGVRGFVSDSWHEMWSLGKDKTDTYGDTPGLMRATGNTVRFAPGDYFAAARSPQGVARQVGMGGGVTINVSTPILTPDGARELQRLFQKYQGIYPTPMGVR